MEKDIFSNKIVAEELIYNKDYYNNVFKKTEKIANAVFFIFADSKKDFNPNDKIEERVKDIFIDLLEFSSEMVMLDHRKAKTHMLELSRRLLLARGYLDLSIQQGTLTATYGSVLTKEIEILLETVAEYFSEHRSVPTPLDTKGFVFKNDLYQRKKKEARVETHSSQQNQKDRKERIKDILRSKGHMGIKDISSIISDISEKSIQRDLNSMIKDREVNRTGERRWSTYSLSVSDIPNKSQE